MGEPKDEKGDLPIDDTPDDPIAFVDHLQKKRVTRERSHGGSAMLER